jgi:hypothetical protein
MKASSLALRFGTILVLLSGFLTQTQAQLKLDALTFGPGLETVGYFADSVGWTFVPSEDLRVVAVGCDFMIGSFVEIDFWDGTNQIIANYQIPLTNEEASNVVYQAVDGLVLKAGSTYGVSLQNSPGGALPVMIYSRRSVLGPTQGSGPTATFEPSPFITQFANFQIATNNVWSPVPGSTNNSEVLYFGATFQFEMLRQLSCSPLANGILLSWPTQSVSFAVQQNSAGFDKAAWVTLTNPPVVVVVGSENQVSVPRPTGNALYRLINEKNEAASGPH